MGLFHKHTYKLLSADDMLKLAVEINGVEVHPERKYTATIEQCTECYKLRDQEFAGHHSARLLKKYGKVK